MGDSMNEQRFRSFAERYVVERAKHFKVGEEEADGWKAILDAKSLFAKIESVSEGFRTKPESADAYQAHRSLMGMTGPIQAVKYPGPPLGVAKPKARI